MRAGILARLASHHGDIANHVFVQTGVIFEQVATGVAHPDSSLEALLAVLLVGT